MSETDASSGVFDITIPITYDSDDGRKRPSPIPTIEQQMDREVQQVFREWDETVKCRKQSSFQIRPASTSSADRRRRRAEGDKPKSTGDTSNMSAKFVFPEIDIIKREDTNFNTSTESLEEDTRRQFYTECPSTGQRLFRLEIDVAGYDQDNVSVKLSGTRLVIHAMQHATDSGRKSTTEFCRKVKLPSDINLQKLQCTCSNGKLVVQAPAPMRHSMSYSGTPTMGSPKMEPLNKPIIKNSNLGKCMSLTVELGRIFRADDVVVKLKSQNKLVIHAEHKEELPKSRMAATLDREFDLEEKIIPLSLKAGLTTEGLLKITAQVLVEVRVVTNGVDGDDVNGNDASTVTEPAT